MSELAVEVRSAIGRIKRAMPRNIDVMLIAGELEKIMGGEMSSLVNPRLLASREDVKRIADRAEARSALTKRSEPLPKTEGFDKTEHSRITMNIRRAAKRNDRAAADAAATELVSKFPGAKPDVDGLFKRFAGKEKRKSQVAAKKKSKKKR